MNTVKLGTSSLRREYNRIKIRDLYLDDIRMSQSGIAAIVNTYKQLGYLLPFVTIKIDNVKEITYHVTVENQKVVINNDRYNDNNKYIIIDEYQRKLGGAPGWYDEVTVSLLSSDFNGLHKNKDIYYASALYVLIHHLTLAYTPPIAWRFFVHKTFFLNTKIAMPAPFEMNTSISYLTSPPPSKVAKQYIDMQMYLMRMCVIDSNRVSPPLLLVNKQAFAYNIAEFEFTQVDYIIDNYAIKTMSMGNNYVRPSFIFRYNVANVVDDTYEAMSNLYWNVCMYKAMHNKLPQSTLVYDTQFLLNKLTLTPRAPIKDPNIAKYYTSDEVHKVTTGVLRRLEDFESEDEFIQEFEQIRDKFKSKFPYLVASNYLWINKKNKTIEIAYDWNNFIT